MRIVGHPDESQYENRPAGFSTRLTVGRFSTCAFILHDELDICSHCPTKQLDVVFLQSYLSKWLKVV